MLVALLGLPKFVCEDRVLRRRSSGSGAVHRCHRGHDRRVECGLPLCEVVRLERIARVPHHEAAAVEVCRWCMQGFLAVERPQTGCSKFDLVLCSACQLLIVMLVFLVVVYAEDVLVQLPRVLRSLLLVHGVPCHIVADGQAEFPDVDFVVNFIVVVLFRVLAYAVRIVDPVEDFVLFLLGLKVNLVHLQTVTTEHYFGSVRELRLVSGSFLEESLPRIIVRTMPVVVLPLALD